MWSDIISTVEDVQYCEVFLVVLGRIQSKMWRIFTTVEETSQKCEGCSVVWEDTMSTVKGYHSILQRTFTIVGGHYL